MRKIILGYMFALLTAGLVRASIHSIIEYGVIGILPAVIEVSVATLFAWVIGDMSCSYGEDALDLINRQKAEIERLQNAYKQCAWERDTFLEEQKSAKSEAIKEFAERLKEMKHNKQILRLPLLDLDIDNLVKEMAGDE